MTNGCWDGEHYNFGFSPFSIFDNSNVALEGHVSAYFPLTLQTAILDLDNFVEE